MSGCLVGLGLTIFFLALKVNSPYTRHPPRLNSFGQILEVVLIKFKIICLVLLYKEQNAISSYMYAILFINVCTCYKDSNCIVVIIE